MQSHESAVRSKLSITERQRFLRKCSPRLALTEVSVDHSTQQRLVHRQEFAELGVGETVTELSIDGGKARLRTEKGKASEWRDYKAVTLNKQNCAAFFQENDKLLASVNAQSLADPVTCLGDGHPRVWNLMADIATALQRREILDWYHLKGNLHKVGGRLVALTNGYGMLKLASGTVKLMQPLRLLPIGTIL